MLDLIWIIVRVVSEIVRMGCDFLGWSTVWVRNAIKERDHRHNARPFRTPVHMGVSFNEKKHIKDEAVVHFLELCLLAGVRRVTLYDPWNECLKKRHDLGKIFADRVKFLCNEPFPDLNDASMSVQLMGIDGGMGTITQALNELISTDVTIPITVSAIENSLSTKGVIEPDVLLQVGKLPTTAGYPPFSLRVTEFIPVRSLPSSRYQFHQTMIDYSSRDIRLGK